MKQYCFFFRVLVSLITFVFSEYFDEFVKIMSPKYFLVPKLLSRRIKKYLILPLQLIRGQRRSLGVLQCSCFLHMNFADAPYCLLNAVTRNGEQSRAVGTASVVTSAAVCCIILLVTGYDFSPPRIGSTMGKE